MNRRTVLAVALGLAAVASAGCSGDDEGGGPIPLESYCTRYASVTCDAAARCDCLGGIPVELCRTFQRSECADDVEAPVRAGRRSFDAAAAGDCLAAIGRIIGDCSLDGDDWPGPCDRMFVGLVAAGGDCTDDLDCRAGLECWSDLCTALPREGTACLDGSYCATDHFCGGGGLCHAVRRAGGACPEGGEACADDLYCDTRTDVCAPYVASGGACGHASWACDDDLYCSPATSTCRPVPGVGGDCADSSGDCAEGAYCDALMTCRARLPAGASCADSEHCLSDDCVGGFCEPVSGGDCPFL